MGVVQSEFQRLEPAVFHDFGYLLALDDCVEHRRPDDDAVVVVVLAPGVGHGDDVLEGLCGRLELVLAGLLEVGMSSEGAFDSLVGH